MKNYLALLLLLATSLPLCAQSYLLAGLRLLDTRQQPMPGETISLIESTTGERLSATTDAAGTVRFELDHGTEWQIHFKGVQHHSTLQMPPVGSRGKTQLSITYNPKRYNQSAAIDRSSIAWQSVDQQHKNYTRPQPGHALVEIKLAGPDGSSYASHLPVALVQGKLQTKYLSRTDNYGQAVLMVPLGYEYELDIDQRTNHSRIEVPQREGLTLSQRILYVATRVDEREAQDTIVQRLAANQRPSSDRALVSVRIKNRQGDEDVYLQDTKTQKVFRAKTNPEGVATFLLPLGARYLVHFDFQRDVDVVDLRHMQGIGSAELSLVYRPDPKLEFPERFIPTPEQLLLTEFNHFVQKQLAQPTPSKKVAYRVWWGNRVNKLSREAVLNIGFTVLDAEQMRLNAPAINVAFVMDHSGSMAGYERIESLQRSLARYVDQLRPEDKVSLVGFNHEAKLLLPAAPRGDGAALRAEILKLEAGGGTEILPGMLIGYEQLKKHFDPRGTNRLVLLTDGYGTDSTALIVNQSKAYNQQGFQLSAIGVGYDYNQALLRLLATEGGGLLQYTGEAEGIDAIFANELESVLRPIARDASFEIEYNKHIVFRQLYGFDLHRQGNGQVAVELKNLYAGLNHLAMATFALNKPSEKIENEPIILRLKYFDLETQKEVVDEQQLRLQWSDYTGQLEIQKNQEEKKLWAIAILNQSLKVMAEANLAGDFAAASQALASARAQVQQLFPKAADADVDKLMAELDRYTQAFANIAQSQYRKKN